MFFDEIMAQAPFFQDAGKGSGTGPDISQPIFPTLLMAGPATPRTTASGDEA